jgi:hypothetical protein
MLDIARKMVFTGKVTDRPSLNKQVAAEDGTTKKDAQPKEMQP